MHGRLFGRVIRAVAAGLVMMSTLAACHSNPVGVKEPGIVGTVASVTGGETSLRALLRDLQIPDPRGVEEKAVNIDRKTVVVVRRANGVVRTGSWADITVGAVLRVEHTPGEARTSPLQYDAIRVEVVPLPRD